MCLRIWFFSIFLLLTSVHVSVALKCYTCGKSIDCIHSADENVTRDDCDYCAERRGTATNGKDRFIIYECISEERVAERNLPRNGCKKMDKVDMCTCNETDLCNDGTLPNKFTVKTTTLTLTTSESSSTTPSLTSTTSESSSATPLTESTTSSSTTSRTSVVLVSLSGPITVFILFF